MTDVITGSDTAAASHRPPAQCATCRFWEHRGGTILPAEVTCTAMEDQGLTPPVARLLTALQLTLAATQECPNFSALEQRPDSYLSLDLLGARERVPEPAKMEESAAVSIKPGSSETGVSDATTAARATQQSRRGRPPSAGFFENRKELCAYIWDKYLNTKFKPPQIALKAGVSQAVVNRILNDGEGKPVPLSESLKPASAWIAAGAAISELTESWKAPATDPGTGRPNT